MAKKPSKGRAKPKAEAPKPKRGPRESFHMPADLHSAFLRYVNDQELEPDKSVVLRKALQRYLEHVGYWPPKPQAHPQE